MISIEFIESIDWREYGPARRMHAHPKDNP